MTMWVVCQEWRVHVNKTGTSSHELQYNLNGSNPDGSFTLDDSNSFLSPYKILPTAQENKYLFVYTTYIYMIK